jgi:hypothetical protein
MKAVKENRAMGKSYTHFNQDSSVSKGIEL